MTYSSAVFATPDQSLADAQRNKYRLMAERAGLTGGERVLEIGSGWGGFALYAAGELGCRRHDRSPSRPRSTRSPPSASGRPAWSISSAWSCATTASIAGTWDAIVSIEMLEAVGPEYYPDLLRCLRPGARAGRPDEPPVDHLPRVRLPGRSCEA